jgi:hypothetical protein
MLVPCAVALLGVGGVIAWMPSDVTLGIWWFAGWLQDELQQYRTRMSEIENSLFQALVQLVDSDGCVFFAWENPQTAQCRAFASNFFLPHFQQVFLMLVLCMQVLCM